jgi:hypothetical protein
MDGSTCFYLRERLQFYCFISPVFLFLSYFLPLRCVLFLSIKTPTEDRTMTSVLYSAGLNYQTGNPVRQEIVAVRRDLDALRKHVEILTEENNIYRKHLLKLLQGSEENDTAAVTEFKRDIMALSVSVAPSSSSSSSRPAGVGTVQGGGFRR